MNTSSEWLRGIVDRAAQEAHAARERAGERADCEVSARAWERLQDAADAIEARLIREDSYPTGEPASTLVH